jgi:DNA-binding MarR family transcriptional regulator
MDMVDGNQLIQPKDYQALAEFRYHIRLYLRFAEQMARSGGLEPQQHQLLLAVKGFPEGRRATIGEIAERLQIQHHSAVELINRLVERGLVERQRDESDQRRVLVSLTSQGEEILKQLSALALAELRTIGPTLARTLNVLVKDTVSSEQSSPTMEGIKQNSDHLFK